MVATPKARLGSWVAGLSACLLTAALSPAFSLDHPIIQEVLYDGPGTDADDVFTEIYGPPGTSLAGWKLVGINGDGGSAYRTLELTGAVIPGDGLLLIATASAIGEVLAHRDFIAEVDWQNGPDAVQLVDPQGRVVDALQYGDAGEYNAGEGTPAPLVSAGQSLSRDLAGTDTDDNFADFTPQTTPTPGLGPPVQPSGGGSSLVVSVPDTAAVRGRSLSIPVQLSDPQGRGVVAVEVFLSYDGSLLAVDSVSAAHSLLTPAWTLVANVLQGIDTSIDTLKVVMATSQDSLSRAGTLFDIYFSVADSRRPAFSPLTLEHVLFNREMLADQLVHGKIKVIGTEGSLTVQPTQLPLPGTFAVQVGDVDEDRHPETPDHLSVRVVEGEQVESLILEETGNSTGVFAGAIAALLGEPISGDGAIQTWPGRTIAFCSTDSLNAQGQIAEHCATAEAMGGRDGRLTATAVLQPGDTLRVCVVDLDLNRDPGSQERASATAINRTTGETETVALAEVSADDSLFFGQLATTRIPSSSGDSILAVQGADPVQVIYADALSALGVPAQVLDTTWVVNQFGDVDANGLAQAFDASKVLNHVLSPFLTGLDSLAANLDSLAPFSAITPYDAALILQHRVGLRHRFPVQEPEALNHPQPGTAARAPKRAAEERLLSLEWGDDGLSLWLSDRTAIVAGEVALEGIEGRVEPGAGMDDFLVAWRTGQGRLHLALAGPIPVSGPGELVRIHPTSEPAEIRLSRAQFNDCHLEGRTAQGILFGSVPSRFALHPNYPNPFNSGTAIRFDLARASAVELEVFDLLGQQIRTLISALLPAGTHSSVWDGCDEEGRAAGSGVYLCRLQAGGFSEVQPMVLLR